MKLCKAFTLIEVLISIVLLGLIIPALYKSVDMLRSSNKALYTHLQQSQKEAQAIQTLFLDIAGSDGNITIRKDEFDRLCLEGTQNSLYGLASPKVCWVVFKEGHDLVRVEGYDYRLPLRESDYVEADTVVKSLELFDVYWQKGNVVVMLKQKHKEPISFMVQGITKPKKRIKKPHKKTPAAKKPRVPGLNSSPEQTEIPAKNISPEKAVPERGAPPAQPRGGRERSLR